MSGRIEAILAMLEKEPDDPFLHYSLAMEYAAAARPDDAVAAFRRCRELDENYLPAYVEAGKALRAAGKVGYLVDPDGIVIRTRPELEAIRFHSVDDAVEEALAWLDRNRRLGPS